MNSVANKTVATLMNSNFSALKAAPHLGSKPTQSFEDTLQNLKTEHKADKHKVQRDPHPIGKENETKPKDEMSQAPVTEENPVQSDKVSGEIETETEVVQEITETDETEVTSVSEVDKKIELTDLDVVAQTLLSEELMSLISQIADKLNMTPEVLTEKMAALGIETMDLTSLSDLRSLILSVHNLKNMGELLSSEEAIGNLKAIAAMMDQTLKETSQKLEIEPEQVKQLMAQLTVAGQMNTGTPTGDKMQTQEPQQTDLPEVEGTNLTLHDNRSIEKTTDSRQQSSSSGDTNSTFGQMMAQHLNMAKETGATKTVETNVYQQISTKEVLDQIVTKAVVNLGNEKTSMQLQLNPGYLGKVAVSVSSEQGVVKGQFVVENQAVKTMIENNMIGLKTQLEAAGVKVEKIEVTVGNANQFFGNHQDKQPRDQQEARKSNRLRVNRVNAVQFMEDMELSSEVQKNEATLRSQVYENTVEYSA